MATVSVPNKTLSLGEHSQEGLTGQIPMLFIAFHGSDPLLGASRHTLLETDEVRIGRGQRKQWVRSVENGVRVLALTIPDSWMSTKHARILVTKGGARVEDLGSKNGTLINGVPVQGAELNRDDNLELGSTFFRFVNVGNCDIRLALERDVESREIPNGMGTLLPALHSKFRQLTKIAKSHASVIVHGESGTGKELMARSIHQNSGRPGAFVAVNCAAIPDTLLESELFGHKKGAFSGAIADRKGWVEASAGGTLFLDEIGELSAKGQASLLRVLEQKEVMPVGANRPIAVDLRVVAATHRNLLKDVADGVFREDLYARLSTFVMTVPPLRERKAEMGSIVAALLRRSPTETNALFSPAAARALLHYNWPRNIRELDKCLASACVLAETRIELEHLSQSVQLGNTPTTTEKLSGDQALHKELVLLLEKHAGNLTHVGAALGKKRQQIQKWCKRLGIDPKQFRS